MMAGRLGKVLLVDSVGVISAMSECERTEIALRQVRRLAAVPDVCLGGHDVQWPGMVEAPARGPVVTFTPREMVQTHSGAFVSRRSGYLGREAARVRDAFDVMTEAALKAHPAKVEAARRAHPGRVAALRARHDERVAKMKAAHDEMAKEYVEDGRKPPKFRAPRFREPAFVEPAFVPPFTHGQVEMARSYAALAERCAGSGMKCSSVEASAGGTGNGDREEAMLSDFQRLRTLHRRIGDGLAKEVRRHRPSSTGGKRHAIRVRTLVDEVCQGGMCLSDVLSDHGWSTKDPSILDGLRQALCGALDRMQGYRCDKPQNMP